MSVSTRSSSIIESIPANLGRVVDLEPQERVAIKDPVLQTALRKGWIPAEFIRLLGSGNAGTSLLWTADRRSMIFPHNARSGTSSYIFLQAFFYNYQKTEMAWSR